MGRSIAKIRQIVSHKCQQMPGVYQEEICGTSVTAGSLCCARIFFQFALVGTSVGVNLGVGDVPAGCYQAVNSLYLETCVARLVIFIVTEPGFQNTAVTKPQWTRLKVTPQNVGEM